MPDDPTAAAVHPPVRLGRAILAGLLAEVLTIITVLLVTYGRQAVAALPPRDFQLFEQRVGTVMGPTFGLVYTFLMALWVVRRAEGRYLAHALLVGVAAVVLHTLGTLGAPGGYRPIYAVADLGKLVAAVVAALLATRRRAFAVTS